MVQFAICTVSVAPVRKEAAHRSEMISQVLFGETMQVLQEEKEWLKVKCLFDGYEGWLTNHLVTPIDEKKATAKNSYVSTGLLNHVTTTDQLFNLPMGSSLTGYDEETRLLWDEHFKYHGTFRNTEKPFNKSLFLNTIQPWMNAPYLWGGKTFMGVDCSGFAQTVFKVLGIPLLRDASQQVTQGSVVADVAQSKNGDLAFFNNEEGKIVHVGIVLEGGRIVHAAGKVRMDTLTNSGIIIQESGKQTHHLHSIKRMFDQVL